MASNKSGLLKRHVPILTWLPSYQKSWLRLDVIAGLTVAAMVVPEGIAYAGIAGMPPETSLYAAWIALLMFAVFGSSRELVIGVSAAVATISFGTVSSLVDPGSPQFIEMTTALAMLAGVFSIAFGFLKFGVITQFFSESVMAGFVTGIALVTAIKQVPKLLGIEGTDGNFWQRGWGIINNLDQTHGQTLIIGAICICLMVGIERYYDRIPAALVTLIAGIALSKLLNLESRSVDVVGTIPSGLAGPRIPDISLNDWLSLVPGAIGLVLVAFAELIGPDRSIAASRREKINVNQEFVGLGAANAGVGLFQGFAVGSSLSKTSASVSSGVKTQMSSLVAAMVVIPVALFMTGAFYDLPEATLGAIVIIAISGMMKFPQIKILYTVRKIDFGLAIVALMAMLTLETLPALLVAVIASLLAYIWHASKASISRLGRAPGQLTFSDISNHPDYRSLPGLLIVRPNNGIFFGNSNGMQDAILQDVEINADTRAVIIDLSTTTDLDAQSATMFGELKGHLQRLGVDLYLTNVVKPVQEMLERAEVMEKIGDEAIFPNVPRAELAFLERSGDTEGVARLQSTLLAGASKAVRDSIEAAPERSRPGLVNIAIELDSRAKSSNADDQ